MREDFSTPPKACLGVVPVLDGPTETGSGVGPPSAPVWQQHQSADQGGRLDPTAQGVRGHCQVQTSVPQVPEHLQAAVTQCLIRASKLGFKKLLCIFYMNLKYSERRGKPEATSFYPINRENLVILKER